MHGDANEISEGMWLSEQLDEGDFDAGTYAPRQKHSSYQRPLRQLTKSEKAKVVREQKVAETKASGRWRCLTAGCNPPLNAETAAAHSTENGHRVAKWPVRSVEGTRRAKARNRSGYYDQYNRP